MDKTIFVNQNSTNFSIARWLYLKKVIKVNEIPKYAELERTELIKAINNFGFEVKFNHFKETFKKPEGSDLFGDDELFEHF